MKRIVFVLVVLLMVGSVGASSLSDYLVGLDSERYALILNGEVLTENSSDGDIRSIAPKSDLVEEKIEYVEAMEKGFGVAIAFLVPYPEGWKDMSEEEKELKLYNVLLRISKQSGITYISHRAGDKEKTLFNESYMVSSSDKKSRVDDPVVDRVPLYAEYYSYQDDTSFGANIYALSYTAVNDEIFLDITNDNDLKFMGINLVKKGKVNMSLDFILVDEGIYVFAMASVKDKKPKISILFYTVDLELSFYNRIIALSNWFEASLE